MCPVCMATVLIAITGAASAGGAGAALFQHYRARDRSAPRPPGVARSGAQDEAQGQSVRPSSAVRQQLA